MTKERKINILVILGIFSIALAVKLYNDKKSNELLQGETLITFGIFTSYTNVYKSGRVGFFDYKVNRKDYDLRVAKNLDFMEKGDTILIRYSLTHPSISEVEDLYYMEKYKHLRDSEE
jgi:hypothetical protein